MSGLDSMQGLNCYDLIKVIQGLRKKERYKFDSQNNYLYKAQNIMRLGAVMSIILTLWKYNVDKILKSDYSIM